MKSIFCNKKRYYNILFITLLALILTWLTYILTYPDFLDINYRNSDATWHTLLTMTCYSETSMDIHKFLPIVTLGGIDDKFISWGATLPDQYGNYYYTSFSTLGYLLPYMFVKILSLPITEESLFLFNKVILFGILVALSYLILHIFQDNKRKYIYIFIGSVLYCFSPEVLHGTGVVYWHQSLFQLFFLCQIICFFKKDKKLYKMLFMLFCFLNPYLEWTGYIANVGFIIAQIYLESIKIKGARFTNLLNHFLYIIVPTILSGVFYILQYIIMIGGYSFIKTCAWRFLSRTGVSKNILKMMYQLISLFLGYISSGGVFTYIAFLGICALLVYMYYKKRNKITFSLNKSMIGILIILLVTCFENIMMLGHALLYTYDRMKFIFVVVFIVLYGVDMVLKEVSSDLVQKAIVILASTLIVMIGIANYQSYISDDTYVWKIDYRNANIQAKEMVDEYADEAILGSKKSVRGYMNLLFHKGIFEHTNIDDLIEKAKDKGKKYVVYIEATSTENRPHYEYDLDEIQKITVVSVLTGEVVDYYEI